MSQRSQLVMVLESDQVDLNQATQVACGDETLDRQLLEALCRRSTPGQDSAQARAHVEFGLSITMCLSETISEPWVA